MSHAPRLCSMLLIALGFLVAASSVPAQEQLNYNTYYRFPVSVGIEYQMLTPFAAYAGQFTVYQASLQARVPIPPLPFLQPTAQIGLMRFDDLGTLEPERWSHTHWYGALGLTASHRFARNFEVGLGLLAGFSESYFPNMLPEEGTLGQGNLLFELGATLVLDPSYSFSIEVRPNVKYLMALGLLKDYDSFIFGIGFSGHFRFGADPDSPQAIIRSLRFDGVEVPDLYAAMQSYYAKNPLGSVLLTNTEKQEITEIEVSFFQPGFMDSPTACAAVEELAGGESLEVDLYGTFNKEVFTTVGITPLTAEVIVSYKRGQRPVEQRQSVSYDLHDKTALVWNDDRKVAAFITPADSALRNYASFIRKACRDEVVAGLSDALQFGMQVFAALGEIGCLYQPDPTTPFTSFSGNTMAVDSINLPRRTLATVTGDCDDLTVLFCSMMESVGQQSAFITVPGHIYAAFCTGTSARSYAEIHPDRNMSINVDGELWVPVEITMIGKATFLEAWRRGIEQYRGLDEKPQERGFHITREAQETYRAVGLTETDLGLQYGNPDNIVEAFREELGSLVEVLLAEYWEKAEASGSKRDLNRLGIRYAQLGQYGRAETSFRSALEADPTYVTAQINVANVDFLRGDYAGALEGFLNGIQMLMDTGKGQSVMALKVLLNVSKSYYQLARYDEAGQYYARASAIDAEKVQEYVYLAQRASDDTARAAEDRNPRRDIIFARDDEQREE